MNSGPLIDNVGPGGDTTAPKKKGGKNKRLSVERIYQKKSQLEHVLLRPDTYIGSVETVTQSMWVYDEVVGLQNREITFVPGLYKIFDEILVNAADHKQRDPKMDCIKINIDPENNLISIWNNGLGIPVVEHQKEKMQVPTLIFGHLLTSSNYDDEEKKVTGGRNGFGAKLCNIFSKKFTVETASSEYQKKFKQVWKDNMTKTNDPKIVPFSGKDFTEIVFSPDLARFKMEQLDKDTIALMTRRAYDVAGCTRGVKIYLNGQRLPVKDFQSYVNLYLKDKVDENGQPLKVVHEKVNDRWEVCLTQSEKGFQQVSFANSIATTKGGRHVDYVVEQMMKKLIETVKKKAGKGSVNIKPFQVKNHLWVFVNCLVENPSFDSQTKENMTLQSKKFGSTCNLSEKFFKQSLQCGIVENILNWVRFKAQSQLDKKCHTTKHSKLRGIAKLDDANDAGTKHSDQCVLILTEGDSAKTLAVSGLGVVGRDHYGVFPLRGKLLNVREASHKQIVENQEITNIIKIMGLQYKNSYSQPESLKSLRYGKLMIMTDQDQDGSHIKGLLINFIHHNWPNLLQHRFLEEFITPIVKVFKGKETLNFYSLPEFEDWKQNTENSKSWKVKYYKGLGTSTAKEAKEYFTDMSRHRIPFKYSGSQDDSAITLAFSKKKVDERKEWLTNWLEDRKQRRQDGLADIFLYDKDTRNVTYSDFVNKELVLFSNMDNERSIPSMVDGLKPGQRKVLYTCFKRNDKKEIKVAQLAGSVAELSAYHHGEQSLMSTIINLAQNFVGSNNVNLLQPIGQFGTRLHGGKDAASPRYIFTMLSPLARYLFPAHDDNLLTYLYDDNLRIEPEWYIPIVPTVLINGSEGIGTGWSTKIHNYSTREVCDIMLDMIDGKPPRHMVPSYKNFRGTLEELQTNRFACSGEVSVLDEGTLEITELPVKTWTQTYKEQVLEPMLYGTEKTPVLITDYKEYHTDTTVKFVVKMPPAKLAEAEASGLHKFFKLQTSLNQMSTMVLYDSHGCIRKYEDVSEILAEFFELRLVYYAKRKNWLEGVLEAEALKLSNQARFVLEVVNGELVLVNRTTKALIKLFVERGYDSDPVKLWKEAQEQQQSGGGGAEEEPSDSDSQSQVSAATSTASGPDFKYLYTMHINSICSDMVEELLKRRDQKEAELKVIKQKTPKGFWKEDLNSFLTKLGEVEEQERLDEAAIPKATTKKGGAAKRPRKLVAHAETKPTPTGRLVQPRIDPGLTKIIPTKQEKAKALKAKEKQKLENPKLENFGFSKEAKEEPGGSSSLNGDDQPMSLADRLKAKGTVSKKQSTLKFGSKPKRAKVAVISDSDSSGQTGESSSEMDDFGADGSPVAKRQAAPRRAAAAKATKYTFEDTRDSDQIEVDQDSSDGDFKVTNSLESEDETPKRRPAPPAASKKRVISDSDSDDSLGLMAKYGKASSTGQSSSSGVPSIKGKQPSEEDGTENVTPKPKKRALGKKVAPLTTSKKGSAADSKQPSILTAISKAGGKRKKAAQDSVDSADESGDEPPVARTKAAKPAAHKKESKPKKPAAKESRVAFNLVSSSDEEVVPVARKKPASKPLLESGSEEEGDRPAATKKKPTAKKIKPTMKKKPAAKLDSDSDEDVRPVAKKKPTAKKPAINVIDSDESDEEVTSWQPRQGRARKAVKYNFGEDDDDEKGDAESDYVIEDDSDFDI